MVRGDSGMGKMKEIKVKLPDDLYAEFMEIKKKSVINGRQMTNSELFAAAVAVFVVFVAATTGKEEVNQA